MGSSRNGPWPVVCAVFLAVCPAGCSDPGPADPVAPDPPPALSDWDGVGQFVDTSDCGGFDKNGDYLGWECLVWRLEADSTLTLTHVNRHLECGSWCSGPIVVQDGRIVIVEEAAGGGFECDCLYDVAFVIAGVPAAAFEYQLFYDDDTGPAVLTGTFDLAIEPSGVQCEPRDHSIFHGWR